MFRKTILMLMIAGFVSMLAGCGKNYPEEKELRAVLERNLRANQEENVEQALADIDEPLRDSTREVMCKVFADYDLSYQITGFKVLSVEGDTARVKVEQETRKVRGGNFADNRLTAIHTLQKKNGAWKITGTQIVSVKKL